VPSTQMQWRITVIFRAMATFDDQELRIRQKLRDVRLR